MRVIIVGGGYGGLKALETFSKYDGDLEVLLVDHHTYHYFQTESYNFVASRIPLEKTFIYLPTFVASFERNFKFICDEAVKIIDNKLICKKNVLEFDYLIIATGSVTKFLTGFEEKGEFSLGIKSLRAALKVKQFFEKELFDRLEKDRAKKNFNIVVIGGGLSGVEVAAEMRDYFNGYAKANALSCGNVHIKLLSKYILEHQPQKIREKVEKRLNKLGVEIVKHFVDKVEDHIATLDNGETVEFDFAIFTGGIEPSPFIRNLSFKKDKRGFLEVDSYLRVSDNIFAVGDVAVLRDKKGDLIPQTAQSAEISGVLAAKNVLSLIEKRELVKADIKLRGMAIALGGRCALVVTPFGFNIYHTFGWLIKKAIEQFYKCPLQLRARKGYKIIKPCEAKIHKDMKKEPGWSLDYEKEQ